ncbi:hypothetical protein RUESEDTHA_04142 [Ruegeria sp. THAF57]|uniref:4-oxalocrotonate tautomerase n=1 Tax=Ruegeria sp. THAF57 TaxID=2744555 RepID=UPI0015DDE5C3|nr:4-oxalocrotonate tautomerase [Ruegeria sp. THAF57]CAD0187230.1 hypothetical protein RUESEDTHA_04142 [Ruegeria sp. THAF57]
MPLYTIATRKPLPEQMRFDIAQVITDVHCGLTGAPTEFVNVIFMTGYHMRRGAVLGLNGNVRMGGDRNADLYQRLQADMHRRVAEAAGLEQARVFVKLIGVEPHWVVEGGMILPPPGEEAGWLERKNAVHAEMGIASA